MTERKLEDSIFKIQEMYLKQTWQNNCSLLPSLIELSKHRQHYHYFKDKAEELCRYFQELKISYIDKTIDPWLSCPRSDCRHLIALKNRTDKEFSRLCDDIKDSGWNTDFVNDPIFLCDLRGIHEYEVRMGESTPWVEWRRLYGEDDSELSKEGIYWRHDGHHRTDIAKFLKLKIPVKIAKFSFLDKNL